MTRLIYGIILFVFCHSNIFPSPPNDVPTEPDLLTAKLRIEQAICTFKYIRLSAKTTQQGIDELAHLGIITLNEAERCLSKGEEMIISPQKPENTNPDCH